MKEEGSLRSFIKQASKERSLFCKKSCKLSVCHRSSCKNDSSGTEIMDFLASDRMILWGLALVVAGWFPYSSGIYCFPLSNVLNQGMQKKKEKNQGFSKSS